MKFSDIMVRMLTAAILLFALCMRASPAANSEVPGALAQYKKGAKAAQKHLYDKAVDEYTQAIAIDPNYADAYNSRGVAYAKLMDFQKAVADFSQAIALTPENPESYHNRGMVLSQMREYERAIADFDTAIRLKDRDAFVLSKAQALEAAGRKEEAVKAYKRFIDHPNLELNQFVSLAAGRIYDLTVKTENKETIVVDDTVRMVYAEFHFEGPAIEDAPFLGNKRKIWRVGRTYMRSEQGFNPSIGYEMLMIVAEPDYWVINRSTFSGQHGIDKGPTFNTVAPVLSKFAAIYSDSLLTFELCREISFFVQRNASPVRSETVDGVACELYELTFDDYTLTLYVRKDRLVPFQAKLSRAGATLLTVSYDDYQSDLDPDFTLFRPPAGITITEMK